MAIAKKAPAKKKAAPRKKAAPKVRVEHDYTVTFTLEVDEFGHDDEVDRRRTLNVLAGTLYGALGDTFVLVDPEGNRWRGAAHDDRSAVRA